MPLRKRNYSRLLAAACAIVLAAACGRGAAPPAPRERDTPARVERRAPVEQPGRSFGPSVGFHSRRQLAEHFEKHGAEFGTITEEQYLALAQHLRDARAGGDVLELVRDDGSITRYDRASGAFIAFDADGAIRTFFKPNLGERYFRRQAQRRKERR